MQFFVKFASKNKEGGEVPKPLCLEKFTIGLASLDAARAALRDPSIKAEQLELITGGDIISPLPLTEDEARRSKLFHDTNLVRIMVPKGSLNQFIGETFLRGEGDRVLVKLVLGVPWLIKTWLESLKSGEKFPPEQDRAGEESKPVPTLDKSCPKLFYVRARKEGGFLPCCICQHLELFDARVREKGLGGCDYGDNPDNIVFTWIQAWVRQGGESAKLSPKKDRAAEKPESVPVFDESGQRLFGARAQKVLDARAQEVLDARAQEELNNWRWSYRH